MQTIKPTTTGWIVSEDGYSEELRAYLDWVRRYRIYLPRLSADDTIEEALRRMADAVSERRRLPGVRHYRTL